MGNLLPPLGKSAAMGGISFLLSDRQRRVLSAVLLEPQKMFSLTDLIQAAGPGHGATQRYVQELLDAQVLLVDTTKAQRRYQANTAHPIFPELNSICRKAKDMETRARHADNVQDK